MPMVSSMIEYGDDVSDSTSVWPACLSFFEGMTLGFSFSCEACVYLETCSQWFFLFYCEARVY